MSIYLQITKRIGELFKLYRNNSNLSMRDIYRDEKISIATVSDMESGKKLPRIETMITLLNKVGMPLDKVFSSAILPQTNKSAIFGIPPRLNWKQRIRADLTECKFLSTEIDEIIGYIEYRKLNKFTHKK